MRTYLKLMTLEMGRTISRLRDERLSESLVSFYLNYWEVLS